MPAPADAQPPSHLIISASGSHGHCPPRRRCSLLHTDGGASHASPMTLSQPAHGMRSLTVTHRTESHGIAAR
ncbi:hypothetical protein HMPREF9056_02412 [Actinomyces sp. oral taxon 170 str. F0386]|nr:hypothetical protein HMPREF9056_02412 [Actinomyces sp. oral taxon 170 str. F0386]